MADRCVEAAVKAGVIAEFEGRAWLDAFREQGAQGAIVAGACISSSGAASRDESIGHRRTSTAPEVDAQMGRITKRFRRPGRRVARPPAAQRPVVRRHPGIALSIS